MKKSVVWVTLLLLLSPLYAQDNQLGMDIHNKNIETSTVPTFSFSVQPHNFEKVYFVFSYMNSLLTKKKNNLFTQEQSHFQVGFNYRF